MLEVDCKALERSFIQEIINNGEVSQIKDYFSRNSEKVIQSILLFRKAFSGYQLTIEDQLAEGNRVVTRWTARGIHTGELYGIQPSYREISWPGVTFSRYASGQIIEYWVIYDKSEILRQLTL